METKKTNQIVEVVLILLATLFTTIGCERELNKSAELKESAEQTQSLKEAPIAGEEAEELGIIIERNVPVPMRDGVILRADVHRPDRGGTYPVLVQRTPYSKDGNFGQFVKAGYIVVSQDVRGRYESEGTWESIIRLKTHDGEDGYDTVEWAAKLTNSTGKVGTFGASYGGFLQWRLASLRPPSLVCMLPTLFGLARLVDDVGASGIHPGHTLKRASLMAADICRRENLPGVHTTWEAERLWQKDSEKWINWLPWLELPEDFYGYETHTLKQWLKNPHVDPLRLDEGAREIAVPSLQIIGWYDHALGDLLLFRTLVKEAKTKSARTGSRIVIGPWGHGYISDIDFGPDATPNFSALWIRWFDYWLKDRQNGIDKDAPVRIFVMGDNRWRDEQHWPLRRTREKVLYITSDGHANTPSGNGRLVAGKPESGGTDNYVYDPQNPAPTPYGAGLPRACDQRPLAKREDILVYQTEPLTERLEVTGNPVVELYASSSAPETDWFVRLIDVHPNGLARDVCMGMVRACYRHSLAKPELLTPGEVVKYTIRMRPTSNAFLPWHRIRLDITSSDFPWHDRNHNTTANQNADATLVVANQTIYHGGEEATRIILPWIPNPAEEEKPVEEEKHEPDLEKQMYPLHQAAADGDIEQVKSLISNGANVNEKDKDDQTALNLAVRSGHKAMVELLIAKGADVNGKGQYNAAPLHEAAWAGNKKIAQLLIDKGADANALQGESRWTPLHSACSRGHAEVAELLIQKGAEADAKDGWDFTPLHYAIVEGHTDVVKLLVENGAASNNMLHRAVQVRDSKVVEIVLAANVMNLDAKNSRGWTPLHVAISSGFTEGAILLIDYGADANIKNNEGMTPLNMAASMGYDTVVEKFRSKGGDIDQRDDVYGFTALHYAARFGNKDVAEVLIADGADIKAKDMWDYQPIHWAAYHDRSDIVELLIAKGADVNDKTSLGQTPLELAKPRRNTAAIEVLRKHGAEAGAVRNTSDVASEKPYVALERGDIRAVIINNEPVDDEVLPGHRGGYSGVASLTHRPQDKNLFVPLYTGLNFEHIHDGTVKPRDILFEPRRVPMETKQVGQYKVELHQPPTPHWQLESWLRYQLLEDGVLEMTLECIPHARNFENDYIGLFFASYIHQPESLDIHFLGCPSNKVDEKPQWIQGVTPAHGELSTHPALYDNRTFAYDALDMMQQIMPPTPEPPEE